MDNTHYIGIIIQTLCTFLRATSEKNIRQVSLWETCRIQTVKKASQSLRPQAQIKFKAFLPAACTSAKILLGSQTCERKRVRCGEPQPFQTRAQRSGFRLRACQKYFFDTLKAAGVSRQLLLYCVKNYSDMLCCASSQRQAASAAAAPSETAVVS